MQIIETMNIFNLEDGVLFVVDYSKAKVFGKVQKLEMEVYVLKIEMVIIIKIAIVIVSLVIELLHVDDLYFVAINRD